jgi:IS1 family transposase
MGIEIVRVQLKREVVPWGEIKNKRGRKKRISTEGFACTNPLCDYFGMRDESVHALVGNGQGGKGKDIQNLRCQCCGKTFSSRKGAPLYYLKTKLERVEMVLCFLAEGVKESVLVRYTGHSKATISRWLERMGSYSAGWHNILFRDLSLGLIQMDELYAKIRGLSRSSWLWLAIDPLSKAIPSLHLGGRKAIDAYALVHDLEGRLSEDCVPAVTTDGLRSYFHAVTAHFGHWWRPKRARKDHWQVDERLLHGQLVKWKSRRKLYTITRMVWRSRLKLTEVLWAHGLTCRIQTAFIERVNLTFRQGVAPLTRKTWSLPQSEEHLLLHVEWFRFYYHMVRPHQSLRESLPGLKHRYRKRTPAMVLGLTDHIWEVRDILRKPLITAA